MRFLVPLVLLTGLCACSEKPKEVVKTFAMQGEVLRLDPSGQLATVKHGKIEGWMEPMTMDYPVKDKQAFQDLKVGEKIDAKVMVQGTDYWLADVKPAPAGTSEAQPATPSPTQSSAPGSTSSSNTSSTNAASSNTAPATTAAPAKK